MFLINPTQFDYFITQLLKKYSPEEFTTSTVDNTKYVKVLTHKVFCFNNQGTFVGMLEKEAITPIPFTYACKEVAVDAPKDNFVFATLVICLISLSIILVRDLYYQIPLVALQCGLYAIALQRRKLATEDRK